MAGANLVKSTFTSGVLDPRMYSRVDVTHYERGLQQGTNMVLTPYGSARRRGGLRCVDTVREVIDSVAMGPPRLIPLLVAANQREYLLVLTTVEMRIYRNDVLIEDINGSSVDYVGHPYQAADLPNLRVAQAGDVLVLVHEDYAPRLLTNQLALTFTADAPTDVITASSTHGWVTDTPVYVQSTGTLPTPLAAGTAYYVRDVVGATFKLAATAGGAAINITGAGAGTHSVTGYAENNWSLSTISFDKVPQVDYNDIRSPVPTACVMQLVFNLGTTGDTYRLDLEGVLTDPITWAGDSSADERAANIDRLQKAVGNLYNVMGGDVVAARTAGLTYTLTFQNGAARAYEKIDFIPITGGLVCTTTLTTAGVPRTEDAWSATRGYPRTVCFYESRLVFGGTKGQPQTVYMSAINDFYNFDLGSGRDDDAISRTADTDTQNRIMAVVPGRNLQVFSESGEFYFPDQPITPEKSGMIPQTQYGSGNVRPVQLDGVTWFMDYTGTSMRQFIYSDVEQAYSAPSASRLSSHLLTAPVDTAALQTSSDDASSYIYVVNSDGTLAVLHTDRSEDLLGWTPWDTEGYFRAVATLGDAVYFIVEREIWNGAALEAYYVLEKLDETLYLDCAQTVTLGAPGTAFTVASFRNGITYDSRLDGIPNGDITPSGTTATTTTSGTTLEIGLPWTPTLQPMAAALVTQNMIAVNRRARLKRCFVRVKETLSVKCDGYEQEGRFLDVTPLDTAPDAVSGVLQFRLHGWGENVAPVFTQDVPNPMHILGIEYEAELS